MWNLHLTLGVAHLILTQPDLLKPLPKDVLRPQFGSFLQHVQFFLKVLFRSCPSYPSQRRQCLGFQMGPAIGRFAEPALPCLLAMEVAYVDNAICGRKMTAKMNNCMKYGKCHSATPWYLSQRLFGGGSGDVRLNSSLIWGEFAVGCHLRENIVLPGNSSCTVEISSWA